MKTIDFSVLTDSEHAKLLLFFRSAIALYGKMADALEALDAEGFARASGVQAPAEVHEGLQLMMRLVATAASKATVDKVKEQMTASINYDPEKAS